MILLNSQNGPERHINTSLRLNLGGQIHYLQYRILWVDANSEVSSKFS